MRMRSFIIVALVATITCFVLVGCVVEHHDPTGPEIQAEATPTPGPSYTQLWEDYVDLAFNTTCFLGNFCGRVEFHVPYANRVVTVKDLAIRSTSMDLEIRVYGPGGLIGKTTADSFSFNPNVPGTHWAYIIDEANIGSQRHLVINQINQAM